MSSTAKGFTLVECVVALALAALLLTLALPSFSGQTLRMGRLDAVAMLERVQAAQESHRSHHGLYAHEIGALRGVMHTSLQGRYVLTLERQGPEHYRAVATARGPQERDAECPTLTLEVRAGFATPGPSVACWNR